MKKNILCVSGLILWALIICTILSAKIETLMTADVTTYRPASAAQPVILPGDLLFYEDDRMCVYGVRTGSGWESGMRAMALSSDHFSIDRRNHITTSSYYEAYIQYSSKPLCSGDLINPQGKTSLADDHYLILYAGNVPALNSLRRGWTIQAQDSSTLLLSAEQAQQPFMEKRVKAGVASMENLAEYDGAIEMDGAKKKIFSLLDVGEFLKNLPRLAVLSAAMLISCILWIYSCFLIRDTGNKKKRKYLITNAITIFLFSLGMPLVINSIHLPSSLLPRTNIFDWAHYTEEFSQVFDALGRLPSLPDTVRAQIAAAHQRVLVSAGLLVSGVLLAVIIVAIEYCAVRRNKQG